MRLAIADVDERRNVAAQVEQGMQFHRRLGGTKARPREDGEAQIDGGGIERVGGLIQLPAKQSSSWSLRAVWIRLMAKSA